MTKFLIIGKGFLGTTLFETSKIKKFQSEINYHKEISGIDVRNLSSIENFFEKNSADVVVNCTAISNVDEIQKNNQLALQVNSFGAENIAKSCKKYGKKLIHISTDSVFDGQKGMYSEEDLPNPINEYGKTKKLGEDLIKKTVDEFIIIRTNFYGTFTQKTNLFDWVVKNLKNKNEIVGFSDIIFNPLEVHNLSSMILELGTSKFNGIIHLASDEIFSKFEFCLKIAQNMDFSNKLIKKGKIIDSKLIAPRPLNTTLSNDLAKKTLSEKPLKLEDFLKKNK